MYVITADQIDSRHDRDRVGSTLRVLRERLGERLALPPDRTAGDELQLLTADAGAALDAVLLLARTEVWSIGVGIGEVDEPLPTDTRAATGGAFYAARDAVEAAKTRQDHFALVVQAGRHRRSEDVDPLVALMLLQRARRSPEGWELADLLADGSTQRAAAERLGISPQAVSKRAGAAALRIDDAARSALVRLLEDADTSDGSAGAGASGGAGASDGAGAGASGGAAIVEGRGGVG